MGSRGPNPKPVELKLLEGNRGNRPIDVTALFRPEVGVPDAPRWLMPGAKKAWRRLSAELVRYNLLSKVDREAFSMLCQTIGRLELIETSLLAKQKLLTEKGEDPIDAFTASTPNGLRIQSVSYQLLNREQAKLHGLLKSFGLRPDARTAVTAGIRAQLQLFEGGLNESGPQTGTSSQGSDFSEPQGFSDFN
jgi:P27 family predicted phage terminase small subunit